MNEQAKCGLCGEPMPPGEEMFKYHGYSGSCQKQPLKREIAKAERWFHSRDGLFFDRLPNHSVRILKTDGKRPEDGGRIEFDMTLDDGTWASIVLTMSHFNERPNDWHKWMAHHTGTKDLLAGQGDNT